MQQPTISSHLSEPGEVFRDDDDGREPTIIYGESMPPITFVGGGGGGGGDDDDDSAMMREFVASRRVTSNLFDSSGDDECAEDDEGSSSLFSTARFSSTNNATEMQTFSPRVGGASSTYAFHNPHVAHFNASSYYRNSHVVDTVHSSSSATKTTMPQIHRSGGSASGEDDDDDDESIEESEYGDVAEALSCAPVPSEIFYSVEELENRSMLWHKTRFLNSKVERAFMQLFEQKRSNIRLSLALMSLTSLVFAFWDMATYSDIRYNLWFMRLLVACAGFGFLAFTYSSAFHGRLQRVSMGLFICAVAVSVIMTDLMIGNLGSYALMILVMSSYVMLIMDWHELIVVCTFISAAWSTLIFLARTGVVTTPASAHGHPLDIVSNLHAHKRAVSIDSLHEQHSHSALIMSWEDHYASSAIDIVPILFINAVGMLNSYFSYRARRYTFLRNQAKSRHIDMTVTTGRSLRKMVRCILPPTASRSLLKGDELIGDEYRNIVVVVVVIEGLAELLLLANRDQRRTGGNDNNETSADRSTASKSALASGNSSHEHVYKKYKSTSLNIAGVVRIIDVIHREFDLIVDAYGGEKVSSTEDTYVVVSNLSSEPNDTDPSELMTCMALDMRNFIEEFAQRLGYDELSLRMGASRGHVTGVYERRCRRGRFEVWGTPVAQALELVRSADPTMLNSLHMDHSVSSRLSDADFYVSTQAQGPETYYVLAKTSDRAIRPKMYNELQMVSDADKTEDERTLDEYRRQRCVEVLMRENNLQPLAQTLASLASLTPSSSQDAADGRRPSLGGESSSGERRRRNEELWQRRMSIMSAGNRQHASSTPTPRKRYHRPLNVAQLYLYREMKRNRTRRSTFVTVSSRGLYERRSKLGDAQRTELLRDYNRQHGDNFDDSDDEGNGDNQNDASYCAPIDFRAPVSSMLRHVTTNTVAAAAVSTENDDDDEDDDENSIAEHRTRTLLDDQPSSADDSLLLQHLVGGSRTTNRTTAHLHQLVPVAEAAQSAAGNTVGYNDTLLLERNKIGMGGNSSSELRKRRVIGGGDGNSASAAEMSRREEPYSFFETVSSQDDSQGDDDDDNNNKYEKRRHTAYRSFQIFQSRLASSIFNFRHLRDFLPESIIDKSNKFTARVRTMFRPVSASVISEKDFYWISFRDPSEHSRCTKRPQLRHLTLRRHEAFDYFKDHKGGFLASVLLLLLFYICIATIDAYCYAKHTGFFSRSGGGGNNDDNVLFDDDDVLARRALMAWSLQYGVPCSLLLTTGLALLWVRRRQHVITTLCTLCLIACLTMPVVTTLLYPGIPSFATRHFTLLTIFLIIYGYCFVHLSVLVAVSLNVYACTVFAVGVGLAGDEGRWSDMFFFVPTFLVGCVAKSYATKSVAKGYAVLEHCRDQFYQLRESREQMIRVLRNTFPSAWLRHMDMRVFETLVRSESALVIAFEMSGYEQFRQSLPHTNRTSKEFFETLHQQIDEAVRQSSLEKVYTFHGRWLVVGNVNRRFREQQRFAERAGAHAWNFNVRLQRIFTAHFAKYSHVLPVGCKLNYRVVASFGGVTCTVPGNKKMFYCAFGVPVSVCTALLDNGHCRDGHFLCTRHVAETIVPDDNDSKIDIQAFYTIPLFDGAELVETYTVGGKNSIDIGQDELDNDDDDDDDGTAPTAVQYTQLPPDNRAEASVDMSIVTAVDCDESHVYMHASDALTNRIVASMPPIHSGAPTTTTSQYGSVSAVIFGTNNGHVANEYGPGPPERKKNE